MHFAWLASLTVLLFVGFASILYLTLFDSPGGPSDSEAASAPGPETSSSPTTFSCPTDHNALHESAAGLVYRLGCDVAFKGTALSESSGSDLLACIDDCEEAVGCGAVAFGPSTGTCYLIGTDAEYQYAADLQGAILAALIQEEPFQKLLPSSSASAPAATTATSTAASPSATATSTDASTGPLKSHLTSITILPLGDSITFGWSDWPGGKTMNGYRLALRNLLSGTFPLYETEQDPNPPSAIYESITAVGNWSIGNFTNARHEGWIGYDISDIHSKFAVNALLYPESPDLVLLHAGTNNIYHGNDPRVALKDYERLVDEVYHLFPRTVILAAGIVPMDDQILTSLDAKTFNATSWDTQRGFFNGHVEALVKRRAQAGQSMAFVDMARSVTTDDLKDDGVHPIGTGFEKMAHVWFEGIRDIRSSGWL